MRIGLSTYSLAGAFRAGKLDFPGIIKQIAEWGGEHAEIVPLGMDLANDPAMIAAIVKMAADCNIPLSSHTFGANFLTDGEGKDKTPEAVRAEIERVKKEIDATAKLGCSIARHDAGWRNVPQATAEQFDKDLPILIDALGEIADYAMRYGITTSIENHGRHIQGKERVRRVVLGVNRPNFRLVTDVGNVCGVDEDPVAIVKDNADITVMYHFKDNYIRTWVPDPENWSPSAHGKFIKGSITGYGDIDLRTVVKIIKENNFDGNVSIEFEGREESLFAAKRSLDNVKKLFA